MSENSREYVFLCCQATRLSASFSPVRERLGALAGILGEDLSPVRVIVARHPAPPPGKDIPVGKRVGEWVYEPFITMLDAEGFLVEDVLYLYHGRGAFEAVLADEDLEEDPDRWCSYTGVEYERTGKPR